MFDEATMSSTQYVEERKRRTSSSPACETSNEIIRPQWNRLEYKWTLDNFWELRALGSVEALEGDNGDVIWSRRFGDPQRGFWRLKCYPYGDGSNAGRGHISIFLALDIKEMDPPRAYAIFGCYVLDEKGEKVQGSGRSFTRQKFSEASASWGWSQFIKVEGHSLSRMLQHNESLTVKCEIDVYTGLLSTSGVALPSVRTLAEDVIAWASDPTMQDVEIRYGSGKKYTANSFLLSARSKVLCDVLSDTNNRISQKSAPQGLIQLSSPDSPDRPEEGPPQSPSGGYVFFGHPSTPGSPYEPLPSASQTSTAAPSPQTTSPRTAPLDEADSSPVAVSEDLPFSVVGRNIIQFYPKYSENVVLALMTFIHTDKCAFFRDDSDSSKQFNTPAQTAPLSDILELFLLAKKLTVLPLFWKCVEDLLGRIVNRKDVIAIMKVAEEVECPILAKQCKCFLLHCVKELNGDDLLRAILPKSHHLSLAGRLA